MDENTIWKNLEKNNLEEVINNTVTVYNETKSISALKAKLIALILKQKYKAAHELALSILDLEQSVQYKQVLGANYNAAIKDYKYFSEDTLIYLGLINFFENNLTVSIKYFKKADKSYYRDLSRIQNWLVLYIISTIKKNSELYQEVKVMFKEFKKEPLDLSTLSLVEYISGNLENEDLLNSIDSNDPLRTRKLNKVYLYIALKQYEKGDNKSYIENLKKSVSHKTLLEFEYFIGKYLLDNSKK